MLLSEYLAITRGLIQTPQSPIPLIPDALLTTYINIARKQVALDGECVRTFGSISIGSGVVPVSIANLVTTSTAQPLVVRNAWVNAARVDIRPWDWFVNYVLMAQPFPSHPVMAHHGAGALTYLYVASPSGGNLTADVVAMPLTLETDSTPDNVPYPWTDAVPFYAGYYAYMAMQRQADADLFMGRYRELMHRARAEVTSTNLPENDAGGLGAQMAAAKVPLGLPPPSPGRR